jgi:hypothetical protein
MNRTVYRFTFSKAADLGEAEATLHLALFASEGLFGPARVRLEFGYRLDSARNAILVDATTEVGAAVVRVFTSLLLREFGEDNFEVRPTTPLRSSATAVEGRAA